MAVYAIADLHLALGIDKPMDIFGGRWSNYMEKLKQFWEENVSRDDYVIIPGDISWATYLDEARQDFEFIEKLPGHKIISKGNHDYWWTTKSKLERYLTENGFKSISFMHNNSFRAGKIVVCGTRGWLLPGDESFSGEDRKIYERELQRLELSLKSCEIQSGDILIAAMHFPPINLKSINSSFSELMKKYKVSMCIYGHLHGESHRKAVEGNIDGIEYKLVSADYLDFRPCNISLQFL